MFSDLMVKRLRRRTKGCEQCRKRRVKCDETAECCKQCLRLGLPCSGPVVGAVFVDMTNITFNLEQEYHKPERKIVKPSKSKHNQLSRKESGKDHARIAHNKTPSDPCTTATQEPLSNAQREIIEAFFSQEKIPKALPFELDPSLLAEQLFLAQFMQLSRPKHLQPTSPSPWMLSPSEQLSCSKLPPFKHSIRAASTAFHAFINPNISVQEASFRSYAAGLQTYRRFLSSKPDKSKKGDPIPGIEEILIPAFFCLFEIVNCTTAAGCFQHLTAACRIIHQRGPHNCQTGIAHELFLALRLTDAFVAVVDGRQSIFGSEEWRTVPFLQTTDQPPIYHLINIVIQIPDALLVGEPSIHLSDILNFLPTLFERRQSEIQERCIDLLEQLSKWWRDLEFENSKVNFEASQNTPQGRQLSPSTFVFADTFTAFLVSIYDAASVILHSTLHCISPLPSTSHLAQATSHAESVLLISQFQQESSLVGFDLIRNTFPLITIEHMGPGPQMRRRAADILTRWERRGLMGILASTQECRVMRTTRCAKLWMSLGK